MRYVLTFLCVFALGVTGCSEAQGTPPECQTACDCDDGDVCTNDSCLGGSCDHDIRICVDGNDCTHDECDADTGCYYPAKSNDAYCAGYERCGLCNGVWCCIQHYEGDCRDGECYVLDSDELYYPPCSSSWDCDDGNDCTEGLCRDGGCENRQVEDGIRCDADLYDSWVASGTCKAGVCVAPCDLASREELPCPTEGLEHFLCCPCTENCQSICP
jgi:hypothetical protein